MTQATQAELPPRQYEAVYILRPDLTRETAEKVAARVAEVIVREGGTLTLVENWGRRPMSYEIQHYKRGVYVYINYLGDGALVAELERNFRLLDEIMRFQTVKLADDADGIEVDAEQIKFEAIEPAAEGEEEDQTLEQELGLVQQQRPPREDQSAEAKESSKDADGAEATKAEGTKEDGGKADGGKADGGKADGGKAEGAQGDAEKAESAKSEEGGDK